MKPETTEDILELMNGGIYSAVLGAAMELGVFWLLRDRPMTAPDLAQALDIPLNRCHYWLLILHQLGLLEDGPAGYAPSAVAREAILNVQSRDTWAFQAREDRDLLGYVQDLPLNLSRPMPAGQAADLPAGNAVQEIETGSGYTARFTRKLYEIHLAFANSLANLLDLQGVTRLLDLGGGSGVVSFALLRKYAALTCVVVDAETVCQVGRELAAENHLADRITYQAADFLTDPLPIGFDVVLLCDTGYFETDLFRRIYAVLPAAGRLVLVDKFAPHPASAPASRLLAAFVKSLESPSESVGYITTRVVRSRLEQAGFRNITTAPVPHADNLPWNLDWTVLEAYK